MNAELLLQHFERLSEAPDAISRLRRFILDLAVRGKLVQQNPNDEPAAVLLKQISKLTGQTSHLERQLDSEVLFDIPEGWEWSFLGGITTKTGSGSTPRGGQSVYQVSGVPFLRSQNVYDDGLHLNDVAYIDEATHAKMHGTALKAGDLLLNITGGSIGRCCRLPDTPIRANISQHVAIIRLAVVGMRDFVHKVVLSPFFQSFVMEEQTGAGRGGLPKNRMDRIPIPVPPLAEQQRIVARVDELMALCDQLETAQAERESQRDRLVTSSLNGLNNGTDVGAFHEHVRFYFNQLTRLTTRPEHIKQLRQTILNLAVRGRLSSTLDWPEKPEPLREFATLQNGYAFRSEWFVRDGIRLLRNTNVSHGVIRWDDLACLPVNRCAEFKHFQLYEGDVVLSLDRPFIVTGTKVARVRPEDLPALLLQRVGRFQPKLEQLCSEYLFLWLHSPHFTCQIDPGRSNGVPHISSKQVESAEIFVPSLTEQHRIVGKVDGLMALCDQLESQLTITETDSRRLLEAVVHEAVAQAQGTTT